MPTLPRGKLDTVVCILQPCSKAPILQSLSVFSNRSSTMKLSFSIPSKSSYKSNPIIKPSQNFDDDANSNKETNASKHYVTEFDASKSPNTPTKIVIPPIQDHWRPHMRSKNLDLAATDSNGTHAAAEAGSDVSYGLTFRQTRKNVETLLRQKFKDDLRRLPEDRGFEEFEDVPVEGFGAALLAGYGWYEGMGIGKNAKEDVKVVQCEKRTAKEGLGFVADHAAPIRSAKELGRRPQEHGKDGLFVGNIVTIVGGGDAGLKGRIVKKLEDDWVVLMLLGSEEEVKLQMDDIAELGSAEEEGCFKKLNELKIQRVDEDGKGSNLME